MKYPKLLYIFTASTRHSGLFLKYEGQLNGLKQFAQVKAILPLFDRDHGVALLVLGTLFFEIKAIFYLLFFPKAYIRFNPKLVFLNIVASFLSPFKQIYLEHNIHYENELALLGRHKEAKLCRFICRYFSYFPLHHTTVTREIGSHLSSEYGIKETRTHFLQNGFYAFETADKVDAHNVSLVKSFISKGSKVGVFVGHERNYHGIDEILLLLDKDPQLRLVMVGDLIERPHDRVLWLGACETNTLKEIYSCCDFGICSFRPDLLGVSEISSLKTREYLVNGLPILTNSRETAEEFKEIRPYVFNLKEDKQALSTLCETSFSKNDISEIAQKVFDWKYLFKPLLT